jgi:hypothetical protein
VITAGVVIVLIGTLSFVRFVLLDDHASPVGVAEAVDRFRATTTMAATATTMATTARVTASVVSTSVVSTSVVSTSVVSTPTTTPEPVASGQLPDPGVYRYATSGFEHIDSLGGARHDYPAETTITVLSDPCGVRLVWDALHERRDEWVVCRGDTGLDETGGLQYHEFFGRGQVDDLVCDPPMPLLSNAWVAGGPPASVACVLSGEPFATTVAYVGVETVTVAGGDVAARHVVIRYDRPDPYYEHTEQHWWLSAGGLPLRITMAKQSRSDSLVGAVVYDEQVTLELRSPVPDR